MMLGGIACKIKISGNLIAQKNRENIFERRAPIAFFRSFFRRGGLPTDKDDCFYKSHSCK
jgi:hypothetical protein